MNQEDSRLKVLNGIKELIINTGSVYQYRLFQKCLRKKPPVTKVGKLYCRLFMSIQTEINIHEAIL